MIRRIGCGMKIYYAYDADGNEACKCLANESVWIEDIYDSQAPSSKRSNRVNLLTPTQPNIIQQIYGQADSANIHEDIYHRKSFPESRLGLLASAYQEVTNIYLAETFL